MKTKIVQDYYGALYYIEKNKDRELTIFVVDDQEIYLNLIKNQLTANPKFSVHTFTTGEECLNYMELKPDLVILDFHLDGRNPYAQKGDVIYEEIIKREPTTEVVIFSSDEKLTFIEDLKERLPNQVLLKDQKGFSKLYKAVENKLVIKRKQISKKKAIILAALAVVALIVLIVYL